MIHNGTKDQAAIKATLDARHEEADRRHRRRRGAGSISSSRATSSASRSSRTANPHAHSSFEIVLEVIEKLKAAGVKTSDIFVYDRYRGEFMDAGYHKILPAGISGAGLDPDGEPVQDGFPRLRASDPIAGFDHDAFVWMDLVPYGDDPKDDRKYRSHLGKLVTKTVNKIVAIPVLKDHGSAGVTGRLKNMSHGTVNNVARSHSNTFTNVCNQFIPQMVTHPIIRQKFVLQIMDGIRGVYQGGPFAPEM